MRWLLRFVVFAGFLAVAALAAAGAWAWQLLHTPFREHAGELELTVEAGTGATTILNRLEDEGVLPNALLARAFLLYRLGGPSLKAGEYSFDEALTTPQVLDKLVRGEVVTYPVTLIEGLTWEETAEVLAREGFGDLESFRREMRRGDLIADLDPLAENLEGYLYPDTYSFARGTSEADVVATLVRTFRQRYESEVAPLMGRASERTVREMVILASIVEKEAGVETERARIAGVYANRLRIGMALYADPTVIYALKLQGTWDGNIRRPDLKIDSPYNTYLYPGLPPGPICSPRAASMVAAVAPADTRELYFVSRNDGTHEFADNLRDHNRNVEKWQRQYWRERWARERRRR